MKQALQVYSAKSIQDFLDCPRRFELKYLLQQSWPAPITQPVLQFEHHVKLGNEFHHLVHQYLSGIQLDLIKNNSSSDEVILWIQEFQTFFSQFKISQHFSELPLVMPFEGVYFNAVIDFVGLEMNGGILIADWKTSAFPQNKNRLIHSIQSILYPFIVFECRKGLFPDWHGNPDDIEMLYWFADHPGNVITIKYSQAQHNDNRIYLHDMIEKIQAKSPRNFKKTDELKKCAYCQYRSLCERKIEIGDIKGMDDEIDIDILSSEMDFEESIEISF